MPSEENNMKQQGCQMKVDEVMDVVEAEPVKVVCFMAAESTTPPTNYLLHTQNEGNKPLKGDNGADQIKLQDRFNILDKSDSPVKEEKDVVSIGNFQVNNIIHDNKVDAASKEVKYEVVPVANLEANNIIQDKKETYHEDFEFAERGFSPETIKSIREIREMTRRCVKLNKRLEALSKWNWDEVVYISSSDSDGSDNDVTDSADSLDFFWRKAKIPRVEIRSRNRVSHVRTG